MKSKRIIIILIVIIIALSLLASRLYFENVKLIQALRLSNQLIENTSTAYQTLGECASNSDQCNYRESQNNLQKLNSDRDLLQSELTTLLQEINLNVSK